MSFLTTDTLETLFDLGKLVHSKSPSRFKEQLKVLFETVMKMLR